jgi:phenylacetate-CoA ligase
MASPPAGSFWQLVPSPAPQAAAVFAAYQELDRAQWRDPAQIERHQLAALDTLLAHCARHVPYYQRLLGELGLYPRRDPLSWEEFRRLPILTRQEYQTHVQEIRARVLPEGMVAGEPILTSGTTGVPLRIAPTNRTAFWWHAHYLRDLEWAGLDPRGRLAVIRVFAKKPEELPALLAGVSRPYRNKILRGLCESGPLFAMDIRQDPRRQLAWLREVRPHYLISPASNLEFLAGLVAESGHPLENLCAVQIYGEAMSPRTRARIEAGLGVPVKNLYSSTEAGYMASGCPQGDGLHQHAENFIAEVLDPENRPCQPGQTGRLVITTLHNYLGPFIRYDIGDDVTLGDGPCPCGRGLPLWKHVDGGKWRPLLRLPDGRRKSSMGLVSEVHGLEGIHQFQIVQPAIDRIIVRIAPAQGWGPDSATRLAAIVRAHTEGLLDVEVEERAYLERPAGGKFRPVLVEVE